MVHVPTPHTTGISESRFQLTKGNVLIQHLSSPLQHRIYIKASMVTWGVSDVANFHLLQDWFLIIKFSNKKYMESNKEGNIFLIPALLVTAFLQSGGHLVGANTSHLCLGQPRQ